MKQLMQKMQDLLEIIQEPKLRDQKLTTITVGENIIWAKTQWQTKKRVEKHCFDNQWIKENLIQGWEWVLSSPRRTDAGQKNDLYIK